MDESEGWHLVIQSYPTLSQCDINEKRSRKNLILELQAMLRRGKKEKRINTIAFAVTVSFLARSRQKILLPTLIKH